MKEDWFIVQTAKDYDLTYTAVERIARLFPDKFYEKLEEELKSKS